MVLKQCFTLLGILGLNVFILITLDAVLTLPVEIKPSNYHTATLNTENKKLKVDGDYSTKNSETSSLQRTGTLDNTDSSAQLLLRAKSPITHHNTDKNKFVFQLGNQSFKSLPKESISEKESEIHRYSSSKLKNDSRIQTEGNNVAQAVLQMSLSDRSNLPKPFLSNSKIGANDLSETVHSSKRRAAYSPNSQSMQLAVNGEFQHGGNNSHRVPEETLTAVMALVILCSLGIVGGVFGCCCPKKKPTVDSKEETKDTNVANDNGVKVNQEIPLVINTSEIFTADVDLDDRQTEIDTNKDNVSVKEKAKALDNILALQPSPKNRRSMLTPDYPALGSSQKSLDRADNQSEHRRSKNLDVMNSEMSRSMADSITDTQDDITDNLSMYSSTISQPYNPDVVIADSDEEDQFAEIQRGTKILKSFQRAKPPRNRSPATRTPKGKIRKHRQAKSEESQPTPSKDDEEIPTNAQQDSSLSKTNSLDRAEPEQPVITASQNNSLDKSTGSLDVLDATSESLLLKSSDFSDLESDMAASITSIGSDIVTPTKRKGKGAKNKDRKLITADVVMNKNRDMTDERNDASKRYEPKVESPLARRRNEKKSNGSEGKQKRSSKVVGEDADQIAMTSSDKRLSGAPGNAANNIFYLIDPTVKDKCKSVGDVTKDDEQTTEESKGRRQKRDRNVDKQAEESVSPMKRERTSSDPRK